jgi:uncharacterized membrane protein
VSQAGADFQPRQIRWTNLGWVAAAIAAMVAVILSGNLWALNFLHVAAGLLWTGIDLFMGFVVGPALRRVPFEARRAVMTELTPRTMFILPALAIITGTTGWYLARDLGLLAAPYPGFWWVVAALVVLAVLTIQGLFILLPTQVRVYFELIKPEPDRERIARLTRSYFYLIALQGIMQVAIIAIMAKFRMGL